MKKTRSQDIYSNETQGDSKNTDIAIYRQIKQIDDNKTKRNDKQDKQRQGVRAREEVRGEK